MPKLIANSCHYNSPPNHIYDHSKYNHYHPGVCPDYPGEYPDHQSDNPDTIGYSDHPGSVFTILVTLLTILISPLTILVTIWTILATILTILLTF